jgi:hypothetical protein
MIQRTIGNDCVSDSHRTFKNVSRTDTRLDADEISITRRIPQKLGDSCVCQTDTSYQSASPLEVGALVELTSTIILVVMGRRHVVVRTRQRR